MTINPFVARPLNKPSNTLEPIRGGWGSRYFSSAAYSG